MRQLLTITMILAGLSLFSSSCSNDDEEVVRSTNVTLNLKLPENNQTTEDEIELTDVKISFTERNTGVKTNSESFAGNTLKIVLPEGNYDINVEGTVNYTFYGEEIEEIVKAKKEAVVVNGETTNISLDLFFVKKSMPLVFEEIFFTGTLTPEGKQYNGDKYIKIYNNSDEVQYADGLIIGQTNFLTVEKMDYTPNVMSKAVAVDCLIRIPGSGTDYPIAPGKSILIADNAINHKEMNTNSYDLTKADFEWYSESLVGEVDNPQVPNLINFYERMSMHNRGFKGYILARIPSNVTDEQYLTDYEYLYTYDFVFKGVTYPMSGDSYKVPNEWVIDAVNLSVQSVYQWLVMDSSLDMGWTHCGSVDKDPTRYGKSVRRKVASTTSAGRNILKDTNNSTEDFNADATPSLAL